MIPCPMIAGQVEVHRPWTRKTNKHQMWKNLPLTHLEKKRH